MDSGKEVGEERRVKRALCGGGVCCPDGRGLPCQTSPTAPGATLGPPPRPHVPLLFLAPAYAEHATEK